MPQRRIVTYTRVLLLLFCSGGTKKKLISFRAYIRHAAVIGRKKATRFLSLDLAFIEGNIHSLSLKSFSTATGKNHSARWMDIRPEDNASDLYGRGLSPHNLERAPLAKSTLSARISNFSRMTVGVRASVCGLLFAVCFKTRALNRYTNNIVFCEFITVFLGNLASAARLYF